MGVNPTDLEVIARNTRSFLEPHWQTWHRVKGITPNVLSHSTCGRSSLFLQRVLSCKYEVPVFWRSGNPSAKNPSGYLTDEGWVAHAWIVIEQWIVDITADQFGALPVVVLPSSHPSYVESDDVALPKFKIERQKTVDALWQDWMALDMQNKILRR